MTILKRQSDRISDVIGNKWFVIGIHTNTLDIWSFFWYGTLVFRIQTFMSEPLKPTRLSRYNDIGMQTYLMVLAKARTKAGLWQTRTRSIRKSTIGLPKMSVQKLDLSLSESKVVSGV